MTLSWGNTLVEFNKTVTKQKIFVETETETIVDNTGKFLKFTVEKVTPVDTGFAKRSWAFSTKGNGSNRIATVFNTATTAKNPRNRKFRKLIEAGQYYLTWLEYGTIKIAPRRFLYKSVVKAEKQKERWLKQMEKDMAKRFNNG